jgi:O-antigen/teichoic acid export membrane protein
MSPEVVFLMAGSKFAAAGMVVPIVALAYVFYGVGYFLQLGLYLTGNTKTVGMISIAAAALNLGLNYVLISYFGMMGAAWATLLGFVAIAAGSHWLSQRVMPLPLGLKRVAAAVFAAVVLYAICPTGESTPLAITLVAKVACLAAFPVIVCKSGLLTEAELGTIASAKEKTMAKVFGRLGWAASR